MSTLPKMVIDSVEIRTCEEFMPMGGKDFVYGRTHPKETQCSIKAKIGSTVRPGTHSVGCVCARPDGFRLLKVDGAQLTRVGKLILSVRNVPYVSVHVERSH